MLLYVPFSMTNVHFKVQSKYCRNLGETILERKSYMKTEDRDKMDLFFVR